MIKQRETCSPTFLYITDLKQVNILKINQMKLKPDVLVVQRLRGKRLWVRRHRRNRPCTCRTRCPPPEQLSRRHTCWASLVFDVEVKWKRFSTLLSNENGFSWRQTNIEWIEASWDALPFILTNMRGGGIVTLETSHGFRDTSFSVRYLKRKS